MNASARGEGYTLISRTGQPGDDGNIHRIVLLTRLNFYGYRDFYFDRAGVTRATREDPTTAAHDAPTPSKPRFG